MTPGAAAFPRQPTLAVDRCLLMADTCSANIATLQGTLAADFLSWSEGWSKNSGALKEDANYRNVPETLKRQYGRPSLG
jgi:hypothetical protein